MLQAMSTESVQGSDEVDEMYCELCKTKRRSIPAEGFCADCCYYLCSVCIECHSFFFPSHDQKDKSSMPQDFCLKSCADHIDEIIKFYCRSCKQFFCFQCKEKNHKECCNVSHLPTFVQTLELKENTRTTRKALEKTLDSVITRERMVDDYIKSVDVLATKANSKIDRQAQAVKDSVDDSCFKLKQEVSTLESDDKAKLKLEKTQLNAIKSEVISLKADINNAENTGKRCELFISIKTAEEMATTDRVSKVLKTDITEYNFEASTNLLDVLRDQSLGHIRKASIKEDENRWKVVVGEFSMQTPSTVFKKPMLLIRLKEDQVICQPEAIAELSKIEKTLNVVAVVGTYRMGKSFLLNKLVHSNPGFDVGHTERPVTKGIWVLCKHHPSKNNQVQVFLDTEGIDDPDQLVLLDSWIFILSTLLSNVLLYNTKGNFDRAAIDKFKYLSKIKTKIAVAGSEQDDSILDFFFPTFVLVLRDVTIDYTTPADEYFEKKLALKRGNSDDVHSFNEPRKLIRRYFKKRKCFFFEKPTKTKNLKKLMTLPDEELKPIFVKRLDELRNYVETCSPKTLKSGRGVNGRMFCTLLESYVTNINKKTPPSIQTAMQTMAEVENTKTIQTAVDHYNNEMKKRLASYNTPREEAMKEFHKSCMTAALEKLKTDLVFDDEHIYEEKALETFMKHLERFRVTAERNSRAACNRCLDQLNIRIVKNLKNRAYCHPTGYDEYLKDIDWIIKQYKKQSKHLGTQAYEALKDYLNEKEQEELDVRNEMIEAQKQKGATDKDMETTKELDPEIYRVEFVDDKVSIEARQEIEAELIQKCIPEIQVAGMMSIKEKYMELSKMKLEEVERVKDELSENDPQYKAIRAEYEQWAEFSDGATWNFPKY